MTQSRGFFAGISCYDWSGKFTDKDRKFFKDKMIETMKGTDFNNKAAEKSLNELKELIDKCCKEDMGDGANIRFKKMFNTETGRYSLEITVCCPPKHDCT